MNEIQIETNIPCSQKSFTQSLAGTCMAQVLQALCRRLCILSKFTRVKSVRSGFIPVSTNPRPPFLRYPYGESLPILLFIQIIYLVRLSIGVIRVL
jgi:hypothetical protein